MVCSVCCSFSMKVIMGISVYTGRIVIVVRLLVGLVSFEWAGTFSFEFVEILRDEIGWVVLCLFFRF